VAAAVEGAEVAPGDLLSGLLLEGRKQCDRGAGLRRKASQKQDCTMRRAGPFGLTRTLSRDTLPADCPVSRMSTTTRRSPRGLPPRAHFALTAIALLGTWSGPEIP